VADNILATKARKRIAARDSTLIGRAAAATVWAAMKAKTQIGMGLNEEEEERKANTSGNETRYPANLIFLFC